MGNKTAPPNQTIAAGEANPTSEKLPRLCACINEMVLCDRSASGDGTATIPEGQEPSLDHVQQVIDWVAMILEQDAIWNIVWLMPGGRHPAGADDTPEEKWAKIVEEIFLGSAYMGPDGLAGFPSKGRINGSKIGYIYGRFQPTTWSSQAGDGPNAPVERVESPNTDPARSIGVVCQSLTTYGMMARGVSLEQEIGWGGLPASQDALAAPMFQEGGIGAWYANSVVALFNREGKLDSSFVGIIQPAEAFNGNKVTEKARNFGPGTIYTYNPRGNQRTVLADVPITDLLTEEDGKTPRIGPDGNYIVNPLAGIAIEQQIQQEAKSINRTMDAASSAKLSIPGLPALPVGALIPTVRVSVEDQTRAAAGMNQGLSEEEKMTAGIRTGKLTFRVQLDGSHISMVLRTWNNSSKDVAVQMLDASGNPDLKDPAYEMFRDLAIPGGMYAGEATTTVHGEPSRFVGLGTVPPLEDFDAQRAHLRRVRPVGLMRLVVAKRSRAVRPEISADDIIFISRMVPMWSKAEPERNYNFSRLLLSLRDVPYYRSLQAFWVCYAPRDALAEVMWEEGARKRDVGDMVADALKRSNEYHPVRGGKAVVPRTELTVGEDMMPIAVLSHDTNGQARQLWRAHQMKGGGGDGSLPKGIRQVFIETGGISGDLLKKHSDALVKAETAAVNRLTSARDAAKKAYDAKPSDATAATLTAAQQLLIDLLKHPETLPELKALYDFIDAPTATFTKSRWYFQIRNALGQGGWLGESERLAVPALLLGNDGYQGYASTTK